MESTTALMSLIEGVDHCLPFQVIFEEHRARRPKDLLAAMWHELPLSPALRTWMETCALQRGGVDQLLDRLFQAEQEGKSREEQLSALAKKREPGLAPPTPLSKEVQDEIEHLQQEITDLRPYRDALKQMWQELAGAVNNVAQSYKELAQLKQQHSTMKPMRGEDRLAFETRQKEKQAAIRTKEQRCKKNDEPLWKILHAMDCSALCLSGGGIRSASFSLGVIQGLARFSRGALSKQHPPGRKEVSNDRSLLDKLDYLSTVSGGGYLGSWLMAWSRRAGYSHAIDELADAAPTSGDPEPRPVRHLREYTSYLAPHYGFTVDTLTLISIVLRNVFLNWLILVPAVVAVLCLPYLLAGGSFFLAETFKLQTQYSVLTTGLASLAIAAAAYIAAHHMSFPGEEWQIADRSNGAKNAGRSTGDEGRRSEPVTWKWFLLLVLVAAWVVGETWMVSPGLSTTTAIDFLPLCMFSTLPPLVICLYRVHRAYGKGGQGFFIRLEWDETQPKWRKWEWWRLWASFTMPLVTGVFAAALLFGTGKFVSTWMAGKAFSDAIAGTSPSDWLAGDLFSAWGASKDLWDWLAKVQLIRYIAFLAIVPIVLMVLMIASALLSGLLSNVEREEEREWWSRAGGVLMACMVAWVGICAVSFFATEVLRGTWIAALSALGIATGSIGSLTGLSAATSSGLKRVKKEQLTKVQKFLADHSAVAPAACVVAVVCLAIALAALTHWLIETVSGFGVPQPALVVFLGATILAVLANFVIIVNTFSLHGMYRMRLTRAYLGASNLARRPNPFTNFDPRDNLHEADLPHDGTAPLHVINAALNLVATRNLAWQQRKAEPFTFTPLHCGSWRIGYVPTWQYGDFRGVRLGTAMAISGAAFNPNMGYNSSPLVTLLMTFFNARLGWWLPNPVWPHKQKNKDDAFTKRFLRRKGPKVALVPLIEEALGITNDTSKYIQLSDGGHFENLGLYEMVMRRCHSIILVDADADSEFEFEDLGNAIRKIYIDLGIPITFPDFPAGLPMKKGIDSSNLYVIRGEIEYGCKDPGARSGELIYVKPVLNGSEPTDIRAYAAAHKSFPHESTMNQFFNEAQFESYRHLGSSVVEKVASAGSDPSRRDMAAFLDLVRKYCRSAKPSPYARLGQVARTLYAKAAHAD